jgi:hypothetical protein
LLRECQQAAGLVAGQVVTNLASSRGVPHLHRLSYHVEVPRLDDGRLRIDANLPSGRSAAYEPVGRGPPAMGDYVYELTGPKSPTTQRKRRKKRSLLYESPRKRVEVDAT